VLALLALQARVHHSTPAHCTRLTGHEYAVGAAEALIEPVNVSSHRKARHDGQILALAHSPDVKQCATFLGSTVKRDVISAHYAVDPSAAACLRFSMLRRYIEEQIPGAWSWL